MTLPPERISVKRRRDEDPVEALYIQSKKYRPSAVWTLQGFHDTSRLASQPAASLPKESLNLGAGLSTTNTYTHLDQSPTTNAIAERSDAPPPLHTSQKSSTGHQGIASLAAPRPQFAKPIGSCEKPGIISTPESRLRRFHLSQDAFPTLRRQASFTGGIRKHRKPRKDSFALFVERDKGDIIVNHGVHAHRLQRAGVVKPQDDHIKTEPNHSATPIRKRPNAGAAERAWRAETWGMQKGIATKDEHESADKSPTNWDPASISLAEELHQLTMEELKGQTEHSSNFLNPSLKFKPKPPKPRKTKVETNVISENEDAANFDDVDPEGDYIVDTYIRLSVQPPGIDLSHSTYIDPLQALDRSKIGVLVIEEEQEALWEAFAHEESSEPEFESEEDENAEDFHGNDYPEDEVDTEDEYDKSSYKFCIDASDDNEYVNDEPEWSDVESPFP